jgi:hypothetical protein
MVFLMLNTYCSKHGEETKNWINLLKPTGYVMHQVKHFNNYKLYPQCIYVFCICPRTNSDLLHIHQKLIGFCNRDEKRLQRGTDWAFKWCSLRFVFKSLKH